jgi:hypothetical protein
VEDVPERKIMPVGRSVSQFVCCPDVFLPFVTEAALNLFINTNAQELLQEMKPDIKKKMILKTTNFMNKLFAKIPYDMWMLE